MDGIISEGEKNQEIYGIRPGAYISAYFDDSDVSTTGTVDRIGTSKYGHAMLIVARHDTHEFVEVLPAEVLVLED
jgi:hypothetical protein